MYSKAESTRGCERPLSARILDVELWDVRPEGIRALSLDYPKSQAHIEGHELLIAGWVLAEEANSIITLEVLHKGFLLKNCKVNIPRAGVAAAYVLEESKGNKFGFHCKLSMIGLDRVFDLDIQIRMQNGLCDEKKVKIGRVKAEKTSSFATAPAFQPVRVTALGRSGTTLLMQILTAHEQVLTTNFYPYEVKPAQYWLHFFHVASAPADFDNSAHPRTFATNIYKIGHNPFNHPHYTRQYPSTQRIENYYSNHVVNSLANFCISQINDYYHLIAEEENKPNAKYFAEKFKPNKLTAVCDDLYVGTKELVLTRDFRDMLCSARAFNMKRNNQGFGRAKVNDDFEWVDFIAQGTSRRLLEHWQGRKGLSLHVKYEDLVLNTESEVRRILDYLQLENSDASVARITETVFSERSALAIHKTSNSPAHSVGRWRRDMSDELKAYCQVKFSDSLKGFNYEL